MTVLIRLYVCRLRKWNAGCKACLNGFHKELDCYARGSSFQPPQLRRRLAIYNKTHGDNPPADHTFKEYKPKGVNADHTDNRSFRRDSNPMSTTEKKDPIHRKPFNNYATKSGPRPAIKSFVFKDGALVEHELDQDDETSTTYTEDHHSPTPELKSFILDQQSYENHDTQNNEDILAPTSCCFVSNPHEQTTSPSTIR